MKIVSAVLLAMLVSTVSQAQMMHGSVSTSGYFPMVEGARYEYMHTGGMWASSTVVVRAGQTWAGQSGLYAMHYNYECRAGVSCATNATEFYGMGPGGSYYYGGTGADPTGARFSMTTLTAPECVLRDTVYPGTMMGGGWYSNAGAWTSNVSGMGNMWGTGSYMSTYSAQSLETVTTPAGTFTNVLHVREQRGSGIIRDVWYAPGVGIIMIDDGTQVMRLSGYTMPGAVAQPAGGAAALPFTPATGMWWNPNESGTGYNLQVQHGVMVVTMFSYNPAGDPVWYYAPGRLSSTGNGVMMTASLDRYRGGQCTSCSYSRPTVAGSDGTLTIIFSSPTSAVIQLPGGRTTAIQPQAW